MALSVYIYIYSLLLRGKLSPAEKCRLIVAEDFHIRVFTFHMYLLLFSARSAKLEKRLVQVIQEDDDEKMEEV